MPKWKALRNTWSIACTWASPPGQPNGSTRAVVAHARSPGSASAAAACPARRPPGARGPGATAGRAATARPRAGDDRRGRGAVGRRGGERVAPAVDDADVRRVRPRRRAARSPTGWAAAAAAPSRTAAAAAPAHARSGSITARALARRARRESSAVERDVDEGRIAVVVLAVGEHALERLDHPVHVRRRCCARGRPARPPRASAAPARSTGPWHHGPQRQDRPCRASGSLTGSS